MSSTIRVLYAEDNPQDADLTRAHFETRAPDLELVLVETGKACLEAVAKGGFDALLLDNRLPDMDGLDVLGELRKQHRFLPAVMVTGVGDEALVVKALRAGACDYVIKSEGYRTQLPAILRRAVAECRERKKLSRAATPRERRVLYVEPNEMDVQLTENHFSRAAPHLSLTVVSTCPDALARLQTESDIDLVLTDLRTPGMSALEFIHEARKAGLHVPFIVFTGRGDEEAAVAALQLGASDYIVKREGYLTQVAYAIESAIQRLELERLSARQHEELEALNRSLEEKVRQRTAELTKEIEVRKEAEVAVQASEKRLRGLIDGLGPNMFVGLMTLDGRVIEANRSALEAAGLKLDDVLNKPVEETYWWAYSEEIQARIRDAVTRAAQGESSRFDVEVRVSEGQFVTLDFSVQPMYDTTGRVVLLVPSAVVITERKRVEMDLRETESRFRALVDASAQIVWTTNAEGLVLEDSPSWRAYTGQTFEAWQGTGWLDAIHPDDRERVISLWRTAVVRKAALELEYRIHHVSGAWHWSAVRAVPLLGNDGEVRSWVGMNTDVTERRLAEAKLKEREEQLRLFARHSPAAIAMLDREMRYLVASRRWREDFRLGEQSLIGRSHYEVFPDIPTRWIEIHRRCLAGAIESSDEESFQRKDGTVDWLRWEIRPWYQADGTIGGIIIFSEDITDRKQAAEAVRVSSERLRLALEAAQMGTFEWDIAGGVLTWSHWHQELWGYAPGEFDGTFDAFASRVHPDDLPDINTEVARCIADRLHFHREFRVVWPDGSIHWVQGDGEFDLGADGKPLRMRGVVLETTARKQADTALRESEERWKFALEGARDGVWDLHVPTRTVRFSDQWKTMLGYAPDELPDRFETWTQLVHPEDLPRSLADFNAYLAGKTPTYVSEHRLRCKDGTQKWILARGMAVGRDEAGQPLRMVGTHTDVTRLRAAETEVRELNATLEQRVLERTLQLEAANQELESFSYSVSHDLRAPLRAVNGFAHIIAETQHEHLDPDGQRYVNLILQASTRMGQLIEDLLRFSRMGRRTLQLRPVDLGAIISSVRADLAPRVAATGARIDVAADLPVVMGDPTLLQQIFTNLIDNAMAYRRPGVPSQINVTAAVAGDRVRVTVKDNGIGIAPEHHEKIFNVFQRLHADEAIPGTGIGLAIVKRAAGFMGGSVAVASVPGAGSEFSIELAVAAPYHGLL